MNNRARNVNNQSKWLNISNLSKQCHYLGPLQGIIRYGFLLPLSNWQVGFVVQDTFVPDMRVVDLEPSANTHRQPFVASIIQELLPGEKSGDHPFGSFECTLKFQFALASPTCLHRNFWESWLESWWREQTEHDGSFLTCCVYSDLGRGNKLIASVWVLLFSSWGENISFGDLMFGYWFSLWVQKDKKVSGSGSVTRASGSRSRSQKPIILPGK